MNSLPIETHQGELRADSRKIAKALGIENRSAIQLLTTYLSDFQKLGLIAFEMGLISGRGRPEKYAYLNDNQAYLLLTFVRNNDKSVPLKVNLINAFSSARQKIKLLSESSASALKSVIPSNQYGEPSKSNGMPKVSIRNSCFYAAKNPKATKLKQAHEVYQITEQLSFFWLLTNEGTK